MWIRSQIIGALLRKVTDFYPPLLPKCVGLESQQETLKDDPKVLENLLSDKLENLKKTTVRFFIFANFKFQCCLFLFCQLKPQS